MLCIQCVLPSAGTVSFNCNIEFPKNVTKLVAPLSIFNFDIFPSLGLSCNLDYNCATSPLSYSTFQMLTYPKSSASCPFSCCSVWQISTR